MTHDDVRPDDDRFDQPGRGGPSRYGAGQPHYGGNPDPAPRGRLGEPNRYGPDQGRSAFGMGSPEPRGAGRDPRPGPAARGPGAGGREPGRGPGPGVPAEPGGPAGREPGAGPGYGGPAGRDPRYAGRDPRDGGDYDGDRTSGLYGGGYGGQPGSAAEARRALRGENDLVAGGPIGPGGPTGPVGPGGRGPGGRGPNGGGPDAPKGKRRRLKKALKITGLAAVVLMILGLATVGLVYVRTEVPDPNALKTNQIATIYYGDGKNVLAKIGSQNRSDVKLTQVPEHVRTAVLAAENRSFYSDPGISPKGITRAAWNNLRGGELQGGSTITQQYVKNVFTNGDRTFKRKFGELFVTVKLDKQYSKDQILEWYLNTIYYGRGAYGIQAASQVYFGKSVTRLSVAEGAVLASSIRSPALYDPQAHPEAAKDRWTFVLNGMVTMGKLSAADKAAQKYPAVRKKTNANLDDVKKSSTGHIVDQVLEELDTAGFDQSRLNQEGLRVVTTIDQKAQEAAVGAVKTTFAGETAGTADTKIRQALVSVEPQTGKVLAYYGGEDGLGTDYAQSWRQAGSAFKPYVLATALQQTLDPETPDDRKVSVYKTYDGSSPQTFVDTPVRNSDNAQCNPCSVLDAMRRSINTVFYKMALDVGPANVAETAHKMGIVAERRVGDKKVPTLAETDGSVVSGIAIGQYEVRTIDQAQGFATFAAGGTLHPAHFVSKVIDKSGKTVWTHEDAPKQVIDSKVANDVTYSMKPIAAASDDPLDNGRESAAKTGTQQYQDSGGNSDGWMVGYTPKVSTAVWVGTNKPMAVKDSQNRNLYGRGLPGETWKWYMDHYLSGSQADELTDQVEVNPQLRPPAPTSAAPTTTASPKPKPKPTRPKPTTPAPTTTTTAPTPTSTEPTPTPTGSATPTATPTRSPRPTRPVPLPPGVP